MSGFSLSFGGGSFPSFNTTSFGGSSFGNSGGGFVGVPSYVTQPTTTQPIGSTGESTGTWWGDLLVQGADITKSFLTWDIMKRQVAQGQYPSVTYTGGGQPGAIAGAGGVGTTGVSGTFLFMILAIVVVLVLVK